MPTPVAIYSKQNDYGIENNIKIMYAKGYNKYGNLDRFKNFDDATITASAVTTTISKLTSGYPLVGNSNTVYTVGANNRPVSSSYSRVIRAVCTVASDGVIIDMSASPLTIGGLDYAIGIPLKVSNLTPTLTIVLEGATGTNTLTLSAVNLANYGFVVNQWGNLKLNLSQFTNSTFSGLDIKKVKITASGAVTIDTQQIQTANNLSALVGAEIYATFTCTKEMEEEIDRKVEMVMCQNTTEDTRSTGAEAKLNFKYLGVSLAHESYSFGTVLKAGEKYVSQVLNSATDKRALKALPVTAGVVATGITIIPENVECVIIGGVTLSRVENVSQVDDTSFHCSATGDFTVSTGYDTQIPTIIIKAIKFVTYVEDKGIVDSFEFALTARRETELGIVETTYGRVKISGLKMAQEDAYVDSECEMGFFPDANRNYKTKVMYS